MKLLTLASLPRYEGRTDAWLPTPAFNPASKEVLAIGSFLPGALAAILFAYFPNGASPLSAEPWILIVASLLALPLHELCHALAHPGLGLSAKTRFGLDSNIGPFCVYVGELRVERFQLTALMPLVLLTIVPLTFQAFGYGCDFARVVGSINASAATMDVLAVLWLRKNIPAKSLIAADGPQGIYRPPS